MDQKAIETKAVNAVRDIIVESAYLDQFIADNDKEPSFDGFVYLYSKPGKKKQDFAGRIAVQVKGTQKRVAIKATTVKHSVDVSDLRNYLSEGGIVYFLVHLSPDGKFKRIFYVDLLPVKIRRILEDAGGQATITLKFKPFPTDATLLRGLFGAFLGHKNKQAVLHDLNEIPKIDDLQKSGQLSGITLSTAGSQFYDNPIEAFLNDDVYVYASLNGLELNYPVDLIYNTIDRFMVHHVDKRISVNGKEFYNGYEVRESNDKTVLSFGKSLTVAFPPTTSALTTLKATLNYKACASMRQRIIDLEFLISLVEADGIEMDGVFLKLPIASKPPLEAAMNELKYWIKAVQALDVLHIVDDIDIKTMTESDFRELDILVSAFVDNQLIHNIREELPFAYVATVCDLRIALVHSEKDEPENMSRIYDLFADNFIYGYTLSDEIDSPQHFVPPCAILDRVAWGMISNINFEDVVPSFKRMYEKNKDSSIFSVINNTLLSILSAYDKTQKKPLLIVAQQLSEWILKECNDETLERQILIINFLQTVKRCRNLDKNEQKQLLEIIEDSNVEERFKVGAYILLDNQEAAETHFDRLDPIIRKDFYEWPIYYFWNEKKNIEDGQT